MNLKTTFLVVAILAITVTAQAITIDRVPVGNPGNTGELSGAGAGGWGPDAIVGAVDYIYWIGKYEITAGQYCEFLNAVAKTDTYGLYNSDMDTLNYTYGCNIKRTDSYGIYSYSVDSDWANRPVNFVSWGDAARFCNWLHNGQPTGAQNSSTTEEGAYPLNGDTSYWGLMAVIRNPTAKYWIPTENEWYKAAYHKNDGVTGNYFDYSTKSDVAPTSQSPPGGSNSANFLDANWAIGSPYYRTEVGAYSGSPSAYGTFDQGGNVWEWNETIVETGPNNLWYGYRGGAYDDYLEGLAASDRHDSDFSESDSIGFRVASVPEPCSITLLVCGVIAGLIWWRWKHK